MAGTVVPCILANAYAAEAALVRALAEIRSAIAQAEVGSRNGAAGALICVDPELAAAAALVQASLVLHRSAPREA